MDEVDYAKLIARSFRIEPEGTVDVGLRPADRNNACISLSVSFASSKKLPSPFMIGWGTVAVHFVNVGNIPSRHEVKFRSRGKLILAIG